MKPKHSLPGEGAPKEVSGYPDTKKESTLRPPGTTPGPALPEDEKLPGLQPQGPRSEEPALWTDTGRMVSVFLEIHERDPAEAQEVLTHARQTLERIRQEQALDKSKRS